MTIPWHLGDQKIEVLFLARRITWVEHHSNFSKKHGPKGVSTIHRLSPCTCNTRDFYKVSPKKNVLKSDSIWANGTILPKPKPELFRHLGRDSLILNHRLVWPTGGLVVIICPDSNEMLGGLILEFLKCASSYWCSFLLPQESLGCHGV